MEECAGGYVHDLKVFDIEPLCCLTFQLWQMKSSSSSKTAGCVRPILTRPYSRNLPWMPRVDFFALLPDASADAVDLLGHMLALDPDDRSHFSLVFTCAWRTGTIRGVHLWKSPIYEVVSFRISVTEALEHAYVRDCRDPEGEPVADHQVGIDAEEEAATSLDDWRGWSTLHIFGHRNSFLETSLLNLGQ